VIKRPRDDKGELLLETLISIAILGVLSVALVMAVFAAITVSSQYKNQSSVASDLRNWAEKASSQALPTCSSMLPTLPGMFQTTTDNEAKPVTCTPVKDDSGVTVPGVLKVRLAVAGPPSDPHSFTQYLDVTVRS
jgi:type II secretory pathway pseudopilin PulG